MQSTRTLSPVLTAGALLTAIAALACGSPSTPSAQPEPPPAAAVEAEAPPPAVAEPETTTPPFTAADIRGAISPGHTYRFAIEADEQPTRHLVITFVEVSETGATMEQVLQEEDGTALHEPVRGETTWDELVDHARFPAEATTMTEETVETPAGTFASTVYTVRDEEDGVPFETRAYFAKELPGMPVQLEMYTEGRRVSRMVLMAIEK